jgi:hypothetical protein
LGQAVVARVDVGVDIGDRRQRGTTFIEHRDALLDALERSDEVALEADQHADRVFVGAAADLVGIVVRPGDDPPALRLGGLGQAPLADEEGRLLLRPGDDPVGLLAGALQDALALLVDPLGLADLLGDGDPQLVDEAEGRVLVDDDVVRQRQLLAVRDQRLEALDEEDDVDLDDLRRPVRRRDYRTSRAVSSAERAAAGTIPETSPPKRAISLTRLELT